MNTDVHVSFQISIFIFLDIYPGMKLVSHVIVLFLIFWAIAILFSIVPAPVYIHTNSVLGFPFLHILATFVICVLSVDSYSDTREGIFWILKYWNFEYWNMLSELSKWKL